MALAEKISLRNVLPKRSGDVVLGDEFVTPGRGVQEKVRVQRERRRFFSLKPSALRRKIVTFNLIALNVLVAGVLYQNSSRDSLALQRANGIVAEAELIADVFEAQLPTGAPVNLATGDGIDVKATMNGLDLHSGVELFVFDRAEVLVGDRKGTGRRTLLGDSDEIKSRTYISDFLSQLWGYVAAPFALGADEVVAPDAQEQVRKLVTATLNSGSQIETGQGGDGAIFAVATPILHDGQAIGVVALASITGEIDYLVRSERERVLQMFVIATLVSIGLSLVLASTIANPLADLAAAAEVGRERNHRGYGSGRIRIPDLTARPDEIGRLSGALRGMVSALYERIESNEEFAADVSHEIKNPLASLRSAVGTLRVAKRDDQREKLLQVIEHDVQRLDRLVSDISNASRLDSEFVKEEEKPFDLLTLLGNLSKHLGEQAREKGIDFISDLPRDPIILNGLEQRLAQVFVNLITNAISFCEEGDAIRVWARRRENRVLIVVEDTGPGIPDQALTKVFKRFYSERPEGQFGNNSGLGLSISKQIVEAHGGVIWAENIRPTDADVTSDPLGARFVVGLPV